MFTGVKGKSTDNRVLHNSLAQARKPRARLVGYVALSKKKEIGEIYRERRRRR